MSQSSTYNNGGGISSITFVTDSGSAATSLGSINIFGSGGLTTSGSGDTVTITFTGSNFTWNDVTTGSATLLSNNGYIADSGSLTTFTLPTNNNFGDTIKIVGKGSGGWKLVYSTGQYVIFGSQSSTTTSGYLSSNNQNDCIELICTTSSATSPIFTVINSIGNITVF